MSEENVDLVRLALGVPDSATETYPSAPTDEAGQVASIIASLLEPAPAECAPPVQTVRQRLGIDP